MVPEISLLLFGGMGCFVDSVPHFCVVAGDKGEDSGDDECAECVGVSIGNGDGDCYAGCDESCNGQP